METNTTPNRTELQRLMRRISQKAFLGFSVLLLANGLFICLAHSQTVDSLSVSSGMTSDSGVPMIFTAVPLPDGQILVGGGFIRFISSDNQSRTNLARICSDGTLDELFNANVVGRTRSDYSAVICIAVQTNGQILIGGSFSQVNGQRRYNIARLNADGTLDTQFDAGFLDNSVNCLVLQPDGQLLICGGFTVVNGQDCNGLCRLNYDGSRDTNFNAGANNSLWSLALQPDSKIVAVGSFTSIGGQPRTNLARLNADGSLDSSFQPVVLTAGWGGGAMSVQPDGKILVGGLFQKVNGLSHTNIVRLNTNGTLDTDFNAQADQYNCWGLQSFTLQTDGKVLVSDDSRKLNGQPCPYLGRLNADGSLDASFSTNIVGNGAMVFSSAVQSDGRILVGGYFGSLGGQTRIMLGRLINTDIATQSLNYDGTNILWLRGGTSPEVWRTSFESSTHGTNWTYLGDGFRIAGGWQLTNVFVSTNATIRARGFVAGGRYNGSSWFVESVYPQAAPTIAMNDGNFGFRTNQFGFNLNGSAGSTVVVDASSTLTDWVPMTTNMLTRGPFYFTDPSPTNSPHIHTAICNCE